GAECPVQYGFNLQQSFITSGWLLWIKLLDGHILNPERTHSMLNSPATIDALEYMRSLIHDKQITPAPGGCGGYAMASGGISMEIAQYARNAAHALAGFDTYDVAPVPRGPSG